jgi:hypothetical protein
VLAYVVVDAEEGRHSFVVPFVRIHGGRLTKDVANVAQVHRHAKSRRFIELLALDLFSSHRELRRGKYCVPPDSNMCVMTRVS